MKKAFDKRGRRRRIQFRIRNKMRGTAQRPRLNVFRSNKEIYCQLIDDLNGATLAAASSLGQAKGKSKIEQAKEVGKAIADAARSNNIETVVFDRSGYLYHGRVKALAEGAREGGLKF